MSPLIDDEKGGDHEGFSNTLLDGLEVAIPPTVASSLLSPVLLLESILRAFLETGRGLLIPGLLLILGMLWTDRRRRRDSVLSLQPDAEPQQ